MNYINKQLFFSIRLNRCFPATGNLGMGPLVPGPGEVTHGNPFGDEPVVPLHREIKTQFLGHPNPETKGTKNIFGAHFEIH